MFRFHTETESFYVLIEPKQKDHPKQFYREDILVFFRKFMVVSVCFETVLFVSVVSIKVRNTETKRNKPKQTDIVCFWFHETNRNTTKQILFRFVSVHTKNFFGLFRGHPSTGYCTRLVVRICLLVVFKSIFF